MNKKTKHRNLGRLGGDDPVVMNVKTKWDIRQEMRSELERIGITSKDFFALCIRALVKRRAQGQSGENRTVRVEVTSVGKNRGKKR